nr:proteasome accessory factor PafA2 family protein [Serinicoccus sp. CNJ-927]
MGGQAPAAGALPGARGRGLGRPADRGHGHPVARPRPARGLARKLRAAGQLERLVTPEEVAAAVTEPPPDTRAWFRGEAVRRYGAAGGVRAASWDSVVLVDDRGGLRRVRMDEPTSGSRAAVVGLLDRHTSAASLLSELASEDV